MTVLAKRAILTPIDRNAAVIAYHQTGGTVTASSAVDGYPAAAPLSPLTYTAWLATTTPATWQLDFASATEVDHVCIAAHTLGTDRAALVVDYFDGSWRRFGTIAPSGDGPIMLLQDAVYATSIRLTVTGDTPPLIGVVYAGRALRMARGIYQGHTPVTLARATVYKNNLSQSGSWLGRSITRAGVMGSFSWAHLTAPWYRAYFDPFVQSARLAPFFISWRPQGLPTEVGYCWTRSDISPSNSGPRDLMTVDLTAEGLGGG
jgi:hypothetical protein